MIRKAERESVPSLRRRVSVLLSQQREILAAIESGELPAGPAYRHRVEGAVTALEAVLGLPPSLAVSRTDQGSPSS